MSGDLGTELEVTAELSLYPLSEDYLTAVLVFIDALQRFAPGDRPAPGRLTALVVNQMSTQLAGPLTVVQQAIAEGLRAVDDAGFQVSLTMKLLNMALDPRVPVDLDAARRD